ncbi:hypothetical protein [Vacuolonema iberomarrocanum]|nr:hypothetical protein [filamentous cyanobacterium LEGE 07170]
MRTDPYAFDFNDLIPANGLEPSSLDQTRLANPRSYPRLMLMAIAKP